MIFYLYFDRFYSKMAKSLINAINKFHNYPNIIICTDDNSLSMIFCDKNIEIRRFNKKKYNYGNWHPLIWAKFNAFNIPTNETIVILDSDIIMYKPLFASVLEFEKSNKIIGASQDDDNFLFQFIKPPLNNINEEIAFNAGAMLIKPDKNVYKELIILADKYHKVARFPEQAILNLFCKINKCWHDLGDKFMLLPFSNKIKDVDKISCLLHFFTPRPDFMCKLVQRDDELSLHEKINLFEKQNCFTYPLQKLQTDFENHLNNQF